MYIYYHTASVVKSHALRCTLCYTVHSDVVVIVDSY